MTLSTNALLSDLSASQRQRLAYIEFKAWFYGEVSRKQVLERFEVASAAGTRDLTLYKELAPDNVVYERKAYRYTPSFQPIFQHEVGSVLAALTTGYGTGDQPALGDLLSHAVPARLNLPPLETLATVTRAIGANHVLSLNYHSMKQGPQTREIIPHSLVDSGLRWHVRAFDRTQGHFRDLVLTRMAQVQPVQGSSPVASEERVNADAQWHRELTLTLVPHPAHPHPKVIARDFGMRRGQLSVTLKAAMAGYVLRQWQVDCSPDARLRGPEFRLWLPDRTQLNGVVSAPLAPGFEDSEAP